jgi:hypothetical protein
MGELSTPCSRELLLVISAGAVGGRWWMPVQLPSGRRTLYCVQEVLEISALEQTVSIDGVTIALHLTLAVPVSERAFTDSKQLRSFLNAQIAS